MSWPQNAAQRAGSVDISSETAANANAVWSRRKADGGFREELSGRRRMLDRGVRFVQVWSGAAAPAATGTIMATSALSCRDRHLHRQAGRCPDTDLKARGLFEDTLLVWSTEFGRIR